MRKLVVGYMPLLDCAPLVVARELGLAAAEGIDLVLVRENSWTSVRDRVVVGHFDAAHMLGPMSVASSLGIGHLRVPLVAPFAFGFGGNAITLSVELDEAVRTAAPDRGGLGDAGTARVVGQGLRTVLEQRRDAGLEPPTFGVGDPFSSHNYELRYWLAASGIHPDRDLRLVVIPPPLLADSMRARQLDGFCAGEPWNSVAVEAGVGSLVLSMTAVWPRSPEKVLGCRAEWAEARAAELAGLLRALHRASAWCGDEANRADLARLLAMPCWVGTPASLLLRGLRGDLSRRRGERIGSVPGFHVPFADGATIPRKRHAVWFYSQMVRWGQAAWSEAGLASARATYRPDIYRDAVACAGVADQEFSSRDVFFDGREFDGADPKGYLDSFCFPAPPSR